MVRSGKPSSSRRASAGSARERSRCRISAAERMLSSRRNAAGKTAPIRSTVGCMATGTDTRERLSRDVIAAGAVALADREGIDAVTIRRLATDNAVTPMALYWHFKDKDAVLDGIAEQIYSG